MSRTINDVTAWPLRMWPKDLGVTLVVLLAFAAGLLLRNSAESATVPYHDATTGFDMLYPASWRNLGAADGPLLQIEDPRTASAYKANVTVEERGLEQGNLPTLQELVDRRVIEHGGLTGYHFLSDTESIVAGNRTAILEYAYVVQPVDMIRSASLPTVVHSREYVVFAPGKVYYIDLSAPESDFSDASDKFDRMVQSVKVR